MRTKFRGVSTREVLLFQGPQGWAEWSPFTEYEDVEAAIWLRAAIDFAFEEQPSLVRTSVGINATLPAVSPEVIETTLAPFGDFATVKIKVAERGQSIEQDIERVSTVHGIYPNAKLRLDANGGYSVDSAKELIDTLLERCIAVEYLEQPVGSLADLAEVRRYANARGLRVAADESIRKASDPLEVSRVGAADIAVIKVAPQGGVLAALEICAQSGLPVVVSSALETSVGISMGLHLAGALPALDFDCGLGTVALLSEDVCAEPMIPVGGQLPVKRVTPDESQLLKLAASPERTRWWLERLSRCGEILQNAN
jgi:O-succinylbenzoate synthase